MENTDDILELLDILYGMVNEAWGVPLGNDKCIIEREKAINLINDIKAALPSSISESKRLVLSRDEFIGNAKREAESLRRNAEEQAEKLINEQEIMYIAKERSVKMISDAEKKSRELRRVASEYVDEMMRKSEEALNDALVVLRQTQSAFKQSAESRGSAVKNAAQTEVGVSTDNGDLPLEF